MSVHTVTSRLHLPTIHLRNAVFKARPAVSCQSRAGKDSPSPALSTPLHLKARFTSHSIHESQHQTPACLAAQEVEEEELEEEPLPEDCFAAGDGSPSRALLLGAAALGVALLFIGADGSNEALALGPEGPLVEEFWENVRRYGLYMLTVSTGVAYAVLQPLIELLKNPFSAVLVIIILVGSGFLLSQVLNLMFGIADFDYRYAS